MFSQLEFLIASRYLRSKRSEGFISIIAGFSLVGIILGVATLIIVMSVMNGFRAELIGRILGLNGHIGIYEYHNNLLEVLDAKTNGDGLGGATIEKKFRKCIEQFSSVVALQRSSIEYSMELAKKQLERAFDLSGIDLNKVFAENKDEDSRK